MKSDLIHALRSLIRRPGHTIMVILCLAAGLTVSIATFSFLMSFLYGDQPGITNRLEMVRVYLSYEVQGRHVSARTLSLEDYRVLRDSGPALGSIAVEGESKMAAIGNHGPLAIGGAFVSGNYFEVLGTSPHVGRLLTPQDERPEAPPVIVVSEYFWRTQLDGKPDAIGEQILLAGRPFTVVGVGPPRFHGRYPGELGEDESYGLQVWIPVQHVESWPGVPAQSEDWLNGLGRLRNRSTAGDAQAQLAVPAAHLAAAYPATRANASVIVRTGGLGLNDTLFEIFLAFGAVLSIPLTVFAIGCANVANLQLARAAERARELAVRLSLGASRWQLIRLLTLETMALAASAVAVSCVATMTIFQFSVYVLPITASIDWRAAAFSFVLLMTVTFATGLLPAWLVLRRPGAAGLKQNAQAGGLGHSRLRSSLVIAQVALSLVMLCAAGVLLRTVRTMQLEAPAILRSQIVADFDPAQAGSGSVEAWQLADQLVERLKTDSRVAAAAISRRGSFNYRDTGRNDGLMRFTALLEITPQWLEVMDLPMRAGRKLTAADDQRVALVSAALADSIAPKTSPLGRMLQVEDSSGNQRLIEIVGVVEDNPTRPMQIGQHPPPIVYVALPRDFSGPFTLRIRTQSSELVPVVSAAFREIVRDVNPRLAWISMRGGKDSYLSDAPTLRYLALAIAALGILALLLAASGLYAVMSYVVSLRRREIGIRVAIGAEPRQIMTMMVRQAFRLVLTGGAIGLGLAIPGAFVLRAVFVGTVSPLDPVAFVPPFALLMIVAFAAAAMPARRASSIDPIHTLRED
jgi:predicted permease